MRTDEELVLSARAGEPDAFAQLVERWTTRCWDIAWRILHDRELAADVAQETMVTAWQQLERLERASAFGGWVSRIARNRALDRLERERRAVATGDQHALEAYATSAAGAAGAVGGLGGGSGSIAVGDPVAALDRAGQQELVWAASAALGERDASVLDLHLRHGLEAAELAEELGIAPNNAHQVLFRLRRRLGTAIRAWLLWRGGRPACPSLGRALAEVGVEAFGADAVRAIDQHVAHCLTCERSRDAVVAPAAMFAAAPLALMPAALGARVLAGLEQAGVPVPAAGLAGVEADGGPGDAGVELAADVGSGGPGASAEAGAGTSGEAGADAAGEAGADASGEAGAGASAEAGAGASAEAGGGASAEAGADASAEAGGGPVAGHGWGVARQVGVGAAVLALVAVLVWLLSSDAGDVETDALAALPGTERPAVPPEVEHAGRAGAAPTAGPDELGGQRFAPVRPFGGDREPAPDVAAPEAPEGTPQPPVDAPDVVGENDPGGRSGEATEPDPDEHHVDREPESIPDPDPEPETEPQPELSPPQIERLQAVVVTAAAGCEELGADVTWETAHAETVELVTDVAVYGGLPPSASGVRVCLSFDSYEITLHARGPAGSVTRVIVADA